MTEQEFYGKLFSSPENQNPTMSVDPIIFDNVLEKVCPKITYLKYRKVCFALYHRYSPDQCFNNYVSTSYDTFAMLYKHLVNYKCFEDI